MWIVRDRLMGDLDEFDSLELAQKFARAISRRVSQLIEVIDHESKSVLVMYLEGEEWCQTKTVQLGFNIGVPSQVATRLGQAIWEDLAERHKILSALAKKPKLSQLEQRQFERTQDAVQTRETQLISCLTDHEYACCFYTFIQKGNERDYPDADPHFSPRHVRRYKNDALEKTGQVAHLEGWNPIGLNGTLDETEYEISEARAEDGGLKSLRK